MVLDELLIVLYGLAGEIVLLFVDLADYHGTACNQQDAKDDSCCNQQSTFQDGIAATIRSLWAVIFLALIDAAVDSALTARCGHRRLISMYFVYALLNAVGRYGYGVGVGENGAVLNDALGFWLRCRCDILNR